MKAIYSTLLILAFPFAIFGQQYCGAVDVYGGGGARIRVQLNYAAYGCQAVAYLTGFNSCNIENQNSMCSSNNMTTGYGNNYVWAQVWITHSHYCGVGGFGGFIHYQDSFTVGIRRC